MKIFAIILIVSYISYLIYEHFTVLRLRKRIKHIIHVNGTRGKSTVTRLIGQVFREEGYKTIVKVTGTIPTIIGFDGKEQPIRRLGNANIKEQIKILKYAAKHNAEVLVIECMAIKGEYQYITQNKMLRANMVVITNARHDHEEELGKGLENVVKSLSNVIPSNGTLFIPDDLYNAYYPIAKEKNSNVITTKPLGIELDVDMYQENIDLAYTVTSHFGINKNTIVSALKGYEKDVGSAYITKLDPLRFINAFSVNDIDSLLVTYELFNEKDLILGDLIILINNRADRPKRLEQHLKFIKKLPVKEVIVAGPGFNKFRKELLDIKVSKFKGVDFIPHEGTIFGIGNIKGSGYDIINYFKELEVTNNDE